MTDQTHEENQDIKALREAANRSRSLEAEVAALKRENAFRRAGLDPDDKRVSYFVKGYDGDLERDAIVAEAKAAGFLTEPSSSPQAQEELSAQQRMAQVSASGQPAGIDKEASLEAAMRDGGMEGLTAAVTALGIPVSSE